MDYARGDKAVRGAPMSAGAVHNRGLFSVFGGYFEECINQLRGNW
jgi:hypothetical protein